MTFISFPVSISIFENKDDLELSQLDYSNFVKCAPGALLGLQEALGVKNSLLKYVIEGPVSQKVCKAYESFVEVIEMAKKQYDKTLGSKVDPLIKHDIRVLEMQWVEKGIFCDQIQRSKGKTCDLVRPFMYENSQFYRIYEDLLEAGKIEDYAGEDFDLELGPFDVYVSKVRSQIMKTFYKEKFRQLLRIGKSKRNTLKLNNFD